MTATAPIASAPVMYHAGVSGLPVASVRTLMANCVVPPNAVVASAYMMDKPPDLTARGSDSVIETIAALPNSC
jgi:hypothetical protein